jgi:hypothetical protein
LLLGAAAGALVGFEIYDINTKVDAGKAAFADQFIASLGAGLYVIAVGTAGILFGGLVEVARGKKVHNVHHDTWYPMRVGMSGAEVTEQYRPVASSELAHAHSANPQNY